MNSFRYSTGLYHSETIGINTTNIELILIILLVFMGGHGLTVTCNVYILNRHRRYIYL